MGRRAWRARGAAREALARDAQARCLLPGGGTGRPLSSATSPSQTSLPSTAWVVLSILRRTALGRRARPRRRTSLRRCADCPGACGRALCGLHANVGAGGTAAATNSRRTEAADRQCRSRAWGTGTWPHVLPAGAGRRAPVRQIAPVSADELVILVDAASGLPAGRRKRTMFQLRGRSRPPWRIGGDDTSHQLPRQRAWS